MLVKRTFSPLSFVFFVIAAVLFAPPLSAQLEDKSTTDAVHWSIAPNSHGQTKIVQGGIEFRPTTRDPFFITGNIQVLGYDRCELTKIVVHFRISNPYSALRSIEVTDPRFGRILYAATEAHGDRTGSELLHAHNVSQRVEFQPVFHPQPSTLKPSSASASTSACPSTPEALETPSSSTA